MAKQYSTKIFPEDIDRDSFGNWLSGFIDGEGCFRLLFICNKRPNGKTYQVPTARFELCLRQDDYETILLIHAYWNGGCLYKKNSMRVGQQPACGYYLSSSVDLWEKVVPHIDKYPLYAKKRHDYVIWRRGVELLCKVRQRTRVHRGEENSGTYPKWTEDEIQEFSYLVNSLKSQRVYQA